MALRFQTMSTGSCLPLSSENTGIIQEMRMQRWLFLLLGFAIGFGILYTWTKQRAPDVVRATPVPVDPNVPTDLSATGRESAAPVDMARVQELTAKIKQNPHDFDSIVELANLNFDQKNYGDAVKLYKTALEIRPEALNVRSEEH